MHFGWQWGEESKTVLLRKAGCCFTYSGKEDKFWDRNIKFCWWFLPHVFRNPSALLSTFLQCHFSCQSFLFFYILTCGMFYLTGDKSNQRRAMEKNGDAGSIGRRNESNWRLSSLDQPRVTEATWDYCTFRVKLPKQLTTASDKRLAKKSQEFSEKPPTCRNS